MRHFLSAISIFSMIIALIFMQACRQKPKRKLGASSLEKIQMSEQAHNSPKISNESITTRDYTLPLCASVPYIPPYDNMAASNLAAWRNEAVQVKISLLQDIHQQGLTESMAVQLALINNPTLFAFYENLEIGYANLLEAGLLENPVFRKSVRFPDEPAKDNTESEILVNFLDYFLKPFRERAKFAELKVIEADIGQKVQDLIKEVRISWLTVKSLELELNQEAKRVELKELAKDLSALQESAGNVNALNARRREIEYDQALTKLRSLEADLEMAREQLNRFLGLFGQETCFRLSETWNGQAEFEAPLPSLNDLEKAALANRADIEAMRREVFALAEEAKLKEPWTYANLVVGVSSETDPDGINVTGPFIELQAPIFNNGQAERKKYGALIEQAQKRLLAKAIDVCSQVREFAKTANLYRLQLEDLEQKILPNFAKQLEDGQALYNVMSIGVYDLFDVKDGEIQAKIDHVHALKNYLVTKTELTHALGGSTTLRGPQ